MVPVCTVAQTSVSEMSMTVAPSPSAGGSSSAPMSAIEATRPACMAVCIIGMRSGGRPGSPMPTLEPPTADVTISGPR